jgi:hypothetical protein
MMMNFDDEISNEILNLRMKADYDERAAEHMEQLDFEKLARIKSKQLNELTDEDLESIGIYRTAHEEFEYLYSYCDLDSIKVYFTKSGDKYELRRWKLQKEKDVTSTTELLEETLFKWRLKSK